MHWNEIEGWFQWRAAQEEAARWFPEGSCFVEVGTYLGRSLCSLGEVVERSGKAFTVIGIDTCRGSGPEGPRRKDYHGAALARGGGTFTGELHRNVLACGYGDTISLMIADSVTASRLFGDASLDWVHLDARHDTAHEWRACRSRRPQASFADDSSGLCDLHGDAISHQSPGQTKIKQVGVAERRERTEHHGLRVPIPAIIADTHERPGGDSSGW